MLETHSLLIGGQIDETNEQGEDRWRLVPDHAQGVSSALAARGIRAGNLCSKRRAQA